MALSTTTVDAEFEIARRIVCSSILDCSIGKVPMPGKTYLGMWGRDSAFMALAFHCLDLHEQALFILRRWSEFMFDVDTSTSLICIRHKGDIAWNEGLSQRPPAAWLRAHRGAFPTNVYIGHDRFVSGESEVYGAEPDVDAATLWLYALGEICTSTRDRGFLTELLPSMQAALCYVRSRQRHDGLIIQGANEDWADTLRRRGVVTYTQATLYAALDAASRLYALLGYEEEAQSHTRNARLVCDSIHRLLRDRDGSYRTADDPAEPGGVCGELALLPVVGVAPDAAPILHSLEALATPFGHRIIECEYPLDRLGPDVYPWGRYHNGGIWPWWLAVEALARAQVGDTEGAVDLIRSAVSQDTVYEWIDARTGEGTHGEFVTGAAALVWACLAGGLV